MLMRLMLMRLMRLRLMRLRLMRLRLRLRLRLRMHPSYLRPWIDAVMRGHSLWLVVWMLLHSLLLLPWHMYAVVVGPSSLLELLLLSSSGIIIMIGDLTHPSSSRWASSLELLVSTGLLLLRTHSILR